MRKYDRTNGIILAGKAWEIREYLKKMKKRYETVYDWCSHSKKVHTAAATPRKNKGSLSIVRPIVVNGKGEAR
ncbi:Z-ring formation inhibitor MciZ [Evansella cellulosilytica]|uniref:Z-ring formation inhibitor MciZ n=1 Tax=Evansella cellulosilytica (strain ATCC 21833 / DSM 2522 / FERM P-1141 / JCM 9156 / N-4) TaxID=649639 RepID=E6TYJ3_EVAC2|nr:Z-ring formation inhibitor MciZ [Evansella cellulosilytica]ADU30043.1 hypothetical protein Bcell_1781 [Evansella cellulosilytica DSM 2522]